MEPKSRKQRRWNESRENGEDGTKRLQYSVIMKAPIKPPYPRFTGEKAEVQLGLDLLGYATK